MELKTVDEIFNDDRVIRYFARNVYGDVKFYPVDYCVEIELLTGMKTMPPRIMQALEEMGFKLVEVFDPQRKGGVR